MLKYTLKRAISLLQSKITSAAGQSPSEPVSETDFEPSSFRASSGEGKTSGQEAGSVDRRTECLRILELKPGASAEEIKKSYRRLCSKFHPDRFANEPEKLKVANDLFAQINQAYDYLQKSGGDSK